MRGWPLASDPAYYLEHALIVAVAFAAGTAWRTRHRWPILGAIAIVLVALLIAAFTPA